MPHESASFQTWLDEIPHLFPPGKKMLQYDKEGTCCKDSENKINCQLLKEETIVPFFWLMNIDRYYQVACNDKKANQNKANVCKPRFKRSNYYNKSDQNDLKAWNSYVKIKRLALKERWKNSSEVEFSH